MARPSHMDGRQRMVNHTVDCDCTLICACTTTDERNACTRACEAVVL